MAETVFVSAYRTRIALTQMWDAIRIGELNVLFHRVKAKEARSRIQVLDVSTILPATIAGIGILSGIKAIPDNWWAIVTFASGVVNQMRHENIPESSSGSA